jgi:hypothetical protein
MMQATLGISHRLQLRRERLSGVVAPDALNPLAVLQRGYAVVRRDGLSGAFQKSRMGTGLPFECPMASLGRQRRDVGCVSHPIAGSEFALRGVQMKKQTKIEELAFEAAFAKLEEIVAKLRQATCLWTMHWLCSRRGKSWPPIAVPGWTRLS